MGSLSYTALERIQDEVDRDLLAAFVTSSLAMNVDNLSDNVSELKSELAGTADAQTLYPRTCYHYKQAKGWSGTVCSDYACSYKGYCWRREQFRDRKKHRDAWCWTVYSGSNWVGC